jgi:hypothetical protein
MEGFLVVIFLFGLSLIIMQHGLAQADEEQEDDNETRIEFRWK